MTIDATHTAFDWDIARSLAEASSIAYSEHSVVDIHTDAQANIVDLGNCVTVAFRGSKDALDFVQDAKFHMKPLLWTERDEVVLVHEGFMEDIDAICGEVTHMVKQRGVSMNKPVFITGHSLGAALAILCGMEFARQQIPIVGIYTFGGPRVGNGTFASIYNDMLGGKTWRIVNENDIVPRIPCWLMGYRHVGQNVFMPVEGGWDMNPSLESLLLSDALGLWGAFQKREDVLRMDHAMQAYLDRVRHLH